MCAVTAPDVEHGIILGCFAFFNEYAGILYPYIPKEKKRMMLNAEYLSFVCRFTDSSSSQSPGHSGKLVSARPPSPPPPSAGPPAEPSSAPPPEHLRPISEPLRQKDTPLPLPYAEKKRGSDIILSKKPSSLLNSVRPPAHPKDGAGSLNGRTKTWESFTAEEFAQQFHESVLQSTQKALQKHKGELSPFFGAVYITEEPTFTA